MNKKYEHRLKEVFNKLVIECFEAFPQNINNETLFKCLEDSCKKIHYTVHGNKKSGKYNESNISKAPFPINDLWRFNTSNLLDDCLRLITDYKWNCNIDEGKKTCKYCKLDIDKGEYHEECHIQTIEFRKKYNDDDKINELYQVIQEMYGAGKIIDPDKVKYMTRGEFYFDSDDSDEWRSLFLFENIDAAYQYVKNYYHDDTAMLLDAYSEFDLHDLFVKDAIVNTLLEDYPDELKERMREKKFKGFNEKEIAEWIAEDYPTILDIFKEDNVNFYNLGFFDEDALADRLLYLDGGWEEFLGQAIFTPIELSDGRVLTP